MESIGLQSFQRPWEVFLQGSDLLIHDVGLNESQANRQRLAARMNRPFVPVQIPEIPADGPGFVIVSGDQTDAALMDVVTGLHELYRAEGQRMADAYVAREAARKVREAELRANPPQPEDVHIRIWKDEQPKVTTTPNP